jgi:hypothetical protein
MILQREFAICTLEFNLGARASDTQYLVVIAFGVRSQKMPFVINTEMTLLSGIPGDLHHGGAQQTVLKFVAAL